MMRRNISETFSPEKNLSLLPVSNSDSRRLSRRSNRPAAACGVVALLLLLAGLLWRSRGESTPTVTSVQTDLGVPADALRDIPRSTGPQPTAGEGAESSREAARRAVEKRALAAASKKEEEAMERHVAKQAGAEGAAAASEGARGGGPCGSTRTAGAAVLSVDLASPQPEQRLRSAAPSTRGHQT